MKKSIFLLIIFCCSIVIGCSPQKKLARLIKKHPELVSTDTVIDTIPIIVPGIRIDTTFKTVFSKDTIYLYKDKLVIKYFNDGKTTRIDAEVKTDTIYKPVPVVVNKVVPFETKNIPWYYTAALWGFISFLLLFIILYTIKNRTAAKS